jgi:hypothetical protein
MSKLLKWFLSNRSQSRRQPARRPTGFRPSIELLEKRELLAQTGYTFERPKDSTENVTSVTATWVLPNISSNFPKPPNGGIDVANASFWVGIDNATQQAGFQWYSQAYAGFPKGYSAWIETTSGPYGNTHDVSLGKDFTISAGDTITVTITYINTTRLATDGTNLSTFSYSITDIKQDGTVGSFYQQITTSVPVSLEAASWEMEVTGPDAQHKQGTESNPYNYFVKTPGSIAFVNCSCTVTANGTSATQAINGPDGTYSNYQGVTATLGDVIDLAPTSPLAVSRSTGAGGRSPSPWPLAPPR